MCSLWYLDVKLGLIQKQYTTKSMFWKCGDTEREGGREAREGGTDGRREGGRDSERDGGRDGRRKE